MKQTLNISWMHCTSCSKLIESTLNNTNYIKSAQVNFWNAKTLVDYDESKISIEEIINIINKLWYKATLGELKKQNEAKEWWKKAIFWAILSLPLSVFMIYDFFPNFIYHNEVMPYMALTSFIISSIILFGIGWVFFKWAYSAIRQKTANMFTLISLWTWSAYIYSLYSYMKYYIEYKSFIWEIPGIFFEVAAFLIVFVSFWKYLENIAKQETQKSIQNLMSLAPKKAKVKRNWEFIDIKIEEIILGDIILIRPWDKIPVDGEIISWNGFIDESMLTWESMSIEKSVWDEVFCWTLNSDNTFEIKALKIGWDMMLSQIIKLLEESSIKKAQIENMSDTISKYFVPIVILIAILTFLVWFFVIWNTFELSLLFATSVVVIACPCALWLATPTAIIVWSGIGARLWILIKWWDALEKASSITAVALDKTWTITTWKPTIKKIKIVSKLITSEKELLKIACSLESLSNHPISKAFEKEKKEKNIDLLEVNNFENKRWLWITWEVLGEKYFLWNDFLAGKLLDKNQKEVFEELKKQWLTVLILGNQKEVLSYIWVSDEIKSTSKEAISNLQKNGIEVFMLTWDNEVQAENIGKQVWIKKENIYSKILPEQKSQIIEEIQKKWYKVAMIWDGINDSIALSRSDLWISMWNGNDIAIESAEVVLIKNDLRDIAKTMELSKKTISKIKQNLFFSLFYNSLWIPIAAWLFINYWITLKPEFAGLAMALSSVSVVVNSLLLKMK